MTLDVETIVEHIEAAFGDVQLDDGVSLHEAEVIDDYGTHDERAAAKKKDLATRWQDVPAHDIENHGSSLSFLDTKGFRYYLPAFMRWSLQNYRRSSSLAVDSTIYALALAGDPVTDTSKRQRFSVFSERQIDVIREFLTYMAFETKITRMAMPP